jgi:hypothetical protein
LEREARIGREAAEQSNEEHHLLDLSQATFHLRISGWAHKKLEIPRRIA